MSRRFILAAAQLGPIARSETRQSAVARMVALMREAHRRGASVVVFPELALSGYECSEDIGAENKSCRMHRESAEVIPGPSTTEMAQLAKDLDVYIIFGMPEQDQTNSDRRYISSVVIAPEAILLPF